MTSSSIEPSGFSEDYSIDELEAIDLDKETVKGLALSQIRFIKARVIDANEAMGTAGSAVYAAMQALSHIKADVKRKKNWTALTESGVLNMSGRMARDLVSAYDLWLKDANIPEHLIAQISVRVLARIGRVDSGKRTHAINKIKQGGGLVDSDLTRIIGNTKSPIRRQIDDLVAQADEQVKRTPDSAKLSKYADLVLENIKLKSNADDKLSSLVSQNKDLMKANSDLRKKNQELTKLLYQASLEGVTPLEQRASVKS